MEGQRSYYTAALTALRYAEERKPTLRRFGKDADAAWRSFKGALTTADRIDLLLRDADVQWHQAFGARSVYALRAIAEDESFGAEWVALPSRTAQRVWREVASAPAPADFREAVMRCAGAWKLELNLVAAGKVSASTRLLLVGPSAVASAGEHFARATGLSWSAQVQCIASPPGHRQVALLAGALLNADGAIRVVTAEQASTLVQPDRVLMSPDATAADQSAAQQWVG
jgi:hypothetical protein